MEQVQHSRHLVFLWAVTRLPTIAFEPKCSKVQEAELLPRPPQRLRELQWVAQPTIVFEPRCKEAELPPVPHQLLLAYLWVEIPLQTIGSEPRCSRVQEAELLPRLRPLQA